MVKRISRREHSAEYENRRGFSSPMPERFDRKEQQTMLNITYLAILEPGEDGSYGISFPDLPGCFSYGENLAHAGQMAAEAASLHVYGLEQDGEEIPAPSLSFPKDEVEGMVVMPVTIHPDLYRAKHDNERIKTNITLPAWLKRLAEEQKVNYSRLLEAALIEYLQIPVSGRQ